MVEHRVADDDPFISDFEQANLFAVIAGASLDDRHDAIQEASQFDSETVRPNELMTAEENIQSLCSILHSGQEQSRKLQKNIEGMGHIELAGIALSVRGSVNRIIDEQNRLELTEIELYGATQQHEAEYVD